MKNVLLSVTLLATLTTVSLAGEVKSKKIKATAKTKMECKTGAGHACCMKRAQV